VALKATWRWHRLVLLLYTKTQGKAVNRGKVWQKVKMEMGNLKEDEEGE
jgi:hypothetical protein